MLRTIVNEFRQAPIGTLSACLGIVSFATAAILSSGFVLTSEHVTGAPSHALATCISVAVCISLATLTAVFLRQGALVLGLVILACSLLFGIAISIAGQISVLALSPESDAYRDATASWLGLSSLAAVPLWLIYSAIVLERFAVKLGVGKNPYSAATTGLLLLLGLPLVLLSNWATWLCLYSPFISNLLNGLDAMMQSLLMPSSDIPPLSKP
jgi:hypothetical protein